MITIHEKQYKITLIVDNSPIINIEVDITDSEGNIEHKIFWFETDNNDGLEAQAYSHLEKILS